MSDGPPPATLDLAARLMTHPRFAWREGMRDQRGVRVAELELWDATDPPDLADPATAGILIELLAETDLLTDIVRQDGTWIVAISLPDGVQGWASDVLGEAAALALLAAWGALPARGSA